MKILIISHNPITSYESMGKTMRQLFCAFDKEELCQFYIYPTLPDIDCCASYFRVTDKDVLKSYARFGKVKGHTVDKSLISEKNDTMFENRKDEGLYRNRKNKKSGRMLLREFMWKFSRWYNVPLRQWLEEQRPEAIFVAPGTGVFLYRIALRIAKERRIPIVTYLCDDYYFVRKQRSLLHKLHMSWLRRNTRKLLSQSSHIVCICTELKERFAEEFKVPATTIMTGTSRPIEKHALERSAPKSITYMGNIRCNRYISLAQIGSALEELNRKLGKDYTLKIYTGENDGEILQTLQNSSAVELCGFVTGKAFEDAFREAQLLLHTEAFDEKNIDLVKDSVSTKIADCLGSGICLVAYGPENVASMRHLLKNGCALAATQEEDLPELLENAFLDSAAREKTVENALQTAAAFHDSQRNSRCLHKLMESV